jgi:hypothetical protein
VAVHKTTSAKRLKELPGLIMEAHDRFEALARNALEHARQAGALLLEAKEDVGHGNFLKWLDDHVPLRKRTVERYMRVAQKWDEIVAKSNASSVTHLSMVEALELISTPRPAAGDEPGNGPKMVVPVLVENEPAEPRQVWIETTGPAETDEQWKRSLAEQAEALDRQRADREAAFDLAAEKDRIRAALGGVLVSWPSSRWKKFFVTVRKVVEEMEEARRRPPKA